MRLTALIPALCCTVALILSFLCLFAGHKQGFMEDYHLITLNTSVIGENLIPEDRDASSSNPITNFLNEIPNRISEEINDRIGDVTERLGIEDWYSAHILNYCEGQYTPSEVVNETISQSDISKNVTECSKMRGMYRFDPTKIVQDALNRVPGLDVTLETIRWPQDIQGGIDTVNALLNAVFVLYVVSICAIFVALVASMASIVFSGRLSALFNTFLSGTGFVIITIASAIVTALMIEATRTINEKGENIGLEANYGSKFLALTWAATSVMFVALVYWCWECCCGRREKKNLAYSKHG